MFLKGGRSKIFPNLSTWIMEDPQEYYANALKISLYKKSRMVAKNVN